MIAAREQKICSVQTAANLNFIQTNSKLIINLNMSLHIVNDN